MRFLILYLSVCGLCSGFFLFHDKGKPLLFCFKICPLYCPKRGTKRYDSDVSSLSYLDHNPYITTEGSDEYEYVHPPPYWKTKTTTKATIAPTTTTEHSIYLDHNPYLIEDGSGEYEYHPPPSFWKSKSTPKPTTTKKPASTIESLVYVDHNPYVIEDYETYPSPHRFVHWKPKPTTKATTTTTEKQIYLDHNPYIIEDWPDYEYYQPPHYYEMWKPKPSPMPTTTAAPTTTEEPTYICALCQQKCEHKSS